MDDITKTEAIVDALLLWQVRYLNQEGDAESSLAVTLFVGGTVITGFAMPALQWFKEAFASEGVVPYANAAEREQVRRDRANALIKRKNDRVELSEDESAKLKDLLSFSFLNLRDARFQTGMGSFAPTTEGLHIRVRLSSVDAWTHGVLGAGPAPERTN